MELNAVEKVFKAIEDYVFKVDQTKPYLKNSALHNQMNQWGMTPLVGLFSGAARLSYGAGRCALGLTATVLSGTLVPLARLVEIAYRKALGKEGQSIDVTACLSASALFALNGLTHLVQGLTEVITLGCSKQISGAYYTVKARFADSETLGMMKAQGCYPGCAEAAQAEIARRKEIARRRQALKV